MHDKKHKNQPPGYLRMVTHIRRMFHAFLWICLFCSNSCGKKESPREPSATIPAHYDLRERQLMTAVKNQNGTKPDGMGDMGSTVGICWAFASLASLESNLLKQGISPNPASKEASLSAWYLGNYIGLNQPCYHFNHETIPGVEPPTTFGYYFPDCGWGGGGSFWTGDYLIAGKPLPLWDDCPMPEARQNARQTLEPPPEVQTGPFPVSRMAIFLAADFASAGAFRESIKKYILTHGAIQGMIHLEPVDLQGITSQVTNGIRYNHARFTDTLNFDMYTYETDNLGTQLLTHCVAIAGWDDNRKLNVDGHRTTGAWLVKDSQGEKNWDKGYFRVAYEDLAVNFLASGLIACTETNFKHQSTYQTHPGILSHLNGISGCNTENCLELGDYGYLLNGYNTGTSWGVAEFPLNMDETLEAIGIFSSNRNQKMTVRIHKDNLASPPLLTREFFVEEVGYHQLKLGKGIRFVSGETMMIGVGFEREPEHQRFSLAYVQNDNFNFHYPTYWGRLVRNQFHVSRYSDMHPTCGFFLQAIVRR